jgi:hypothetical protein
MPPFYPVLLGIQVKDICTILKKDAGRMLLFGKGDGEIIET